MSKLQAMGIGSRIRARLRGLVRRNVVAGEIREELEFHVRMRAEDYERAGLPAPAANAQARRRFGNLAVWQDHGYDIRGGGLMETVWQDARYAVRLLRRQPGFSLVAILTLALGIGMTTAIASAIDAAMLHPFPYAHPEQLAHLTLEFPRPDRPRPSQYAPSAADLQAIRATDTPVTVTSWRNVTSPITDGPEPERLSALAIDAHYLDVLGVAPLRGRGFQSQDTQDGAPPVVLLGYGYWQRRFGGKDDAVGQRLRLDNESAEIVGVLPRGFEATTSVWLPIKVSANAAGMRGAGGSTYARLSPGASVEQVQRRLTDILSGLPAGGLNLTPGWHVRLDPLLEYETRGYWTTANILLGAVVLIMLIACVNVAGLLLARGAGRRHEVAIRASIGAGRGRLIRQLLTESILLALAGCVIGITVAWWTLDSLVANIPLPLSSNVPPTLNWRVLLFSLAVALSTGLLFGVVPAIRLSRARMTQALSRGTPRTGAALSRRSGQWLIGVEVALALVLVTGAGLMIRSFERLVSVDLGFDPESIVTVQASPVELKSPVFIDYYTRLVDSIRQMPGIEAVGAINHLPLMGSAMFTSVTTDDGKNMSITLRLVLPGYFEAMGLKPIAGRFPSQADAASGRTVAVLGEQAAHDLFPDGPALGRTVMVQKQSAEVVGVVAGLKVDGAETTRTYSEVFTLYRPGPAERPGTLVVVARPRSDATGLPERLRQAALTVGPRAIVERVRSGGQWLSGTVVTKKQQTVLLGLLGGLGLLLTLVGVFAMTAYAVARRTREIGVRMAFGAKPGQVVRMMVADAARPLTIGLCAGLVGSWFATRLISTFLFQTTPTDAGTFALSALALCAATLTAIWIPARRAARVNPVTSLRAE